MSVYLYSGTPGSGKSYEAVKNAMLNLRKGHYVIANFGLNFNAKQIKKGYHLKFFYVPNAELTVTYLLKFAIFKGMVLKRAEHQCIVVIDEAGGRFNSRNFQDENRAVWIDFFSQHMKIGFDFVLVAQHDKMIDKQIRTQIETEYKFRLVNRFGIFFMLPFKLFVKVEYWYGIRERVSASWIIFRWKYAEYYDRFKMFDGFHLDPEILAHIAEVQNAVTDEEAKLFIETLHMLGSSEGDPNGEGALGGPRSARVVGANN